MATATKTRSKTKTTTTKAKTTKAKITNARKAPRTAPVKPVRLIATKVGANVVDASGAFLARCSAVPMAELLVESLNQATTPAKPTTKKPPKATTKAAADDCVFDIDDDSEDNDDDYLDDGMFDDDDESPALEFSDVCSKPVGSKTRREFVNRLAEGALDEPIDWTPIGFTLDGFDNRGRSQVTYDVDAQSLVIQAVGTRGRNQMHVHPDTLSAINKVLHALKLD